MESKTVEEIFVTNMRKIRRSKDLSQTELARLAGSTQANIASYEQKRNKPGLGKAFAIANALGVSLEEMCGQTRKEETL